MMKNPEYRQRKIRGRKLQTMKCCRCNQEQLVTRKINQQELYCWECSLVVRKERAAIKEDLTIRND